jgi:hypothetical protein
VKDDPPIVAVSVVVASVLLLVVVGVLALAVMLEPIR